MNTSRILCGKGGGEGRIFVIIGWKVQFAVKLEALIP